jgi:hypothetical protein
MYSIIYYYIYFPYLHQFSSLPDGQVFRRLPKTVIFWKRLMPSEQAAVEMATVSFNFIKKIVLTCCSDFSYSAWSSQSRNAAQLGMQMGKFYQQLVHIYLGHQWARPGGAWAVSLLNSHTSNSKQNFQIIFLTRYNQLVYKFVSWHTYIKWRKHYVKEQPKDSRWKK